MPLHEDFGHQLRGRHIAMHPLAGHQDVLGLVAERDGAPLAVRDRRRRGDLVFDFLLDLADVDTQALEDFHRIGLPVAKDAEKEMVRRRYVTAQPGRFFERIVEHDLDFVGISFVIHVLKKTN